MMKRLLAVLFVLAVVLWGGNGRAAAQSVQRIGYQSGDNYLVVEVLADDLLHFESGAGEMPDLSRPLVTSPMVLKTDTDYEGPLAFRDDGAGGLATDGLEIDVDLDTLCVSVTDVSGADPLLLTRLCPTELSERKSNLVIDPAGTQHVYGLGEKFRTPGEPNGDWVGGERDPGVFGNQMEGFSGGAVGNAQFPIMYGLGAGKENYALFVDVVYKQDWEFVGDEWSMTTSADPLRWYVLTGPDLPDLRRNYMALVGRPTVPPKSLFGLWVSEYGYDDWGELDDKRQTLDDAGFPQDGFVLDLQWFGGIQAPSQMGSLTWDEENFPDPAGKIAQLKAEEGLNTMLIEESYVDRKLGTYGLLASKSYLVKACEDCGPGEMPPRWWGHGGMLDWTHDEAADYWHDNYRQPLIDDGILGHWTDLGEPEMFPTNAWYRGAGTGEHDQVANHNIYNLMWAESIFEGYARNEVEQRPSIMSRSGTSGIQRYGVAMWSADIGTNFDSLATHMNAQMHMSLSGVDYFGSDIGGFHRGNVKGEAFDELYTVWYANSALLDVPMRPHTENLCNCKETAPDRVGDLASNLANTRLRYALSPYFYTVAHQAARTGDPVVPPLFFYYQDDLETRELGDHKMIGRDLLVRTVTEPNVDAVDVYLPAGLWVNFHTGEGIESEGEWVSGVSTRPNGVFQLPLFVRGGAVIPMMAVDEQTMNLAGMRRDGSTRPELVQFAVPEIGLNRSSLIEDDGRTTAYLDGNVRTTRMAVSTTPRQSISFDTLGSDGTFAGAAAERNFVAQVYLADETVWNVGFNGLEGADFPQLASREAWEAAEKGWFVAGNMLWLKSGVMPETIAKNYIVYTAVPSVNLDDGYDSAEDGPIFTDVSDVTGIVNNRVGDDKEIGIAWDDFNQDGGLDLYVTDHAGANTLYESTLDNQFKVSDLNDLVALPEAYSTGASFIDYDNDGWRDLYVLNWGENVLYRNVEGREFVDVTGEAGLGGGDRNSKTASWGDFDQDGDLDLYVANWACYPRCGRPAAGETDRFYQNNGDGTFTEIQSWLSGKINGAGFVASFTDYDNDGDLDIYLVNDEFINPVGNALWRNDGAGCDGWCFVDVSAEAGADTKLMGMGLATADYDNDGDQDFYFSNGGPMTLLQNQGDGTFVDQAFEAGVQTPDTISWGTVFFDFDNDGWQDAYVAISDPVGANGRQNNELFRSNRDGTFTDVSSISGADDPSRTLGVATADFDRDGRLDLLVGNIDTGYFLYRNNGVAGPNHHWLTLELRGGGPVNLDGIGTRVWATTAEGQTQMQELIAGSSLGAGNELMLHFGLGMAAEVAELRVRWPDGTEQVFADVAGDRRVRLGYPVDEAAELAQAEVLYPAVVGDGAVLTSRSTMPVWVQIVVVVFALVVCIGGMVLLRW